MKNLVRLVLILAAITLAAEPAFAIKNGERSRDPNGPRRHVVQITGPDGTRCTGTVIAPRLVLTAAHCFLSGPGDYSIRALTPRFRVRVAGAARVAVHPGFNIGGFASMKPMNDVALIQLAEDLPSWMEPVPIGRVPARSGSQERVLVAGFGMDRDRVTRTAGTLRQARLWTSGGLADGTRTVLLMDKRNRPESALAGVCRGDSGGPVFRETSRGYVLIGVISAVIANAGADCGTITAITPVASYLDYISRTARDVGIPVVLR